MCILLLTRLFRYCSPLYRHPADLYLNAAQRFLLPAILNLNIFCVYPLLLYFSLPYSHNSIDRVNIDILIRIAFDLNPLNWYFEQN